MPTAIIAAFRMGFRDSQGRVAKVNHWISLADETTLVTTAASLAGAYAGLTTSQSWSNLVVPPNIVPRPTAALYQSVQDKANMVFQDVKGAFHRIQVPAPLAALFFADDEITVNPANGLVSAWTTLMIGLACARDGTLYQAFIGGTRIRRKLPRRINITILAPQDEGPAE